MKVAESPRCFNEENRRSRADRDYAMKPDYHISGGGSGRRNGFPRRIAVLGAGPPTRCGSCPPLKNAAASRGGCPSRPFLPIPSPARISAHLHSSMVTMSQKSSVLQPAKSDDGLSSPASKCQSAVARSATMRETVRGKIYQKLALISPRTIFRSTPWRAKALLP